MRRTLLALKQGDRPDLVSALVRTWAGPPAVTGCLVPVPTSPDRVRRRGYDHAVLLAEALAARWGWRMAPRGLVRRISTPRLHPLGPARRRQVLEDAFRVGQVQQGRPVWLVDDLHTTGATMRSCVLTLSGSGCHVSGIVVMARAASGIR
ncbi:MAG: hypothetical protein VKO21_03485 [Candidatus Sericytochromatia bacterium]|nr:hypothetical protein [Candidatus Sericytochromatia bacterium]